ncbi:6-phosphogluconate dehydrogenase C-terminal domain-like protein [Xylariaceae sp. FL0662B]|nr:6-phosphogluconate dehydrogenase C-terminal domain-like protein [Xylariaceae sp. FL0662B]
MNRIKASVWGSTCGRLSHTARPCQNPRHDTAKWLHQLLDKNAEPPRLYAWTLANLPSQSDANPPSRAPGARNSDDELRRVYVLGIGNIGRLYAHSLAKLPKRPPITLVVHRGSLLEYWRTNPFIELWRDGKMERTTEFDIEWWSVEQPTQGPVTEPTAGFGISNLVVATKASDALPQVDRLRRYLNSGSTIAFTQNGMCKLWPPLGQTYVDARFPGGSGPNWLACVTTHGVTSLGPFRSIHASPANITVGPVMPSSKESGRLEYLVEQLVSAPDLAGSRVGRRELWVSQLEKLVVNSVINPLTAILRCKNGELFVDRNGGIDDLPAIIDVLLQETSKTLGALVSHPMSDGILAEGLDSVEGSDNAMEKRRKTLLQRFAVAQLRTMLYNVGAKVSANTSSMLQDVQQGKETEIDDFNGWLVGTAKYLDEDLKLPAHELLISLVKDRALLERDQISTHFRTVMPQRTSKGS